MPLDLVDINGPHPEVLHQQAAEVQFPITTEMRDFIEEMRGFIIQLESPYGKPAGLAAPQVGHSVQVVFIQIPEDTKKVRLNVTETMPLTVLINPSYTPDESAGTFDDWEACYSVNGKMGKVTRFQQVTYQWQDIDGNKHTKVAEGFLAKLIQHEIGHLNGELYVDKLTEDSQFGEMDAMWKIRQAELDAGR